MTTDLWIYQPCSIQKYACVPSKQTGSATLLQSAVLNIGVNGNRFENLELSAVPFREESLPTRRSYLRNTDRAVLGKETANFWRGMISALKRINLLYLYISKIELCDIIPDFLNSILPTSSMVHFEFCRIA